MRGLYCFSLALPLSLLLSQARSYEHELRTAEKTANELTTMVTIRQK